tara:strand:- start:541 stop:831 length:291 start_codon:yes stop_codon:yes gene_type:complete
MTNQEKLEVIEEAFNYYHDRNSLTSDDEKELITLVDEIKEAMQKYADQQLILSGVSQRSELLPEFLMHDLDGKIITSVIGSADVTKEWNEYLGNCG